jgi:hypothetical protein
VTAAVITQSSSSNSAVTKVKAAGHLNQNDAVTACRLQRYMNCVLLSVLRAEAVANAVFVKTDVSNEEDVVALIEVIRYQ